MSSLANRVMLAVARCVVSLVDDAKKMQTVQAQLLKREVRDGIERVQNYGYTSKPHAGAEGVVVFVGGNRDHGLCIAVDDRRYRLTGLEDGEVAIYTDEGDKIHLKRGNVIEVTTQTFRVNAETLIELNAPTVKVAADLFEVDAPLTTFSGDVQADGDILDNASASGSTMASTRATYNGHHHPETGSTTSIPNEQM